jgi:hypothetical protein
MAALVAVVVLLILVVQFLAAQQLNRPRVELVTETTAAVVAPVQVLYMLAAVVVVQEPWEETLLRQITAVTAVTVKYFQSTVVRCITAAAVAARFGIMVQLPVMVVLAVAAVAVQTKQPQERVVALH